MWNLPSKKELSEVPEFYSSESIGLQAKVVHMHFFIGGSDWYAVEYDEKSRTFFGFVILNDDKQSAEWGYFSLDELASISVTGIEIDRDLYFGKPQVKNIEKIQACNV